jgi:hypothetical protein
MVNPFKPGDKVLIFRKGIEMEATVRSTWNHEVQVRVADGELLWRTVKTARLVVEAKPEVITGELCQELPDTSLTPEVAKDEAPPVINPEPLPQPAENIVPFPAAEEPSASFEPSGHNSGKDSRSKSRKKAKKSGKGQVRRTRKDPF